MQRRRKIKYFAAVVLVEIAFILCILCFLISDIGTEQSGNDIILDGLTIVEEEQWDEILSSNSQTPMDRTEVLFDNASIAYDAASNTFYIPQDMESSSWSGTFTTFNLGRLFILNDTYLSDKAGAIADGHSFACLYQAGDVCSLFNLVFTGLPTVAIEYDPEEEFVSKEDHEGQISVREISGSYQTSRCIFHIRGQASSEYPKKSWKISLTTAAGDKNHFSLCGMREDDDWILNAMFMDPTHIREALAYYTWDTMQSMMGYSASSPNMQYVEFFLNDEYYGLFLLMEPLDGKTLDLTQEDFLYQKCWTVLPENETLTQYNGQNQTPYAEIRWPKSGNGSNVLSWDLLQYLYDYTNGLLDWEELLSDGIVPDITNMSIYDIFAVLMGAWDNVVHNMMFEYTLQEDGTYSVKQIPWDLDCVLGTIWTDEIEMDMDSSFVILEEHNFLWNTFTAEFSEESEQCSHAVWKSLRDAGLNAELICDEGEALWHEISESGAFSREEIRWGGVVDYTGVRESDIPLVLEWIRNRFDTLDSYYGYSQSLAGSFSQ